MPHWQSIRAARLQARAREICTLLNAINGRVTGPSPAVGQMQSAPAATTYLKPHTNNPHLARQRLAAYDATATEPDCPRCWIQDGSRSQMVLATASEHVDFLECPLCAFSEFVPRSNEAPGFLMQT